MTFEAKVRSAFEEARGRIEQKYQESAKAIGSKIKEAQEKTYKRLGKET